MTVDEIRQKIERCTREAENCVAAQKNSDDPLGAQQEERWTGLRKCWDTRNMLEQALKERAQ